MTLDGKVICEIFNEDQMWCLEFEEFKPSAQNMRFEMDLFPGSQSVEEFEDEKDELKA